VVKGLPHFEVSSSSAGPSSHRSSLQQSAAKLAKLALPEAGLLPFGGPLLMQVGCGHYCGFLHLLVTFC